MGEFYVNNTPCMEAVPEAPSITKIVVTNNDQLQGCLELTWKLLEHVRGPAPIGTRDSTSPNCLIGDLDNQRAMINAIRDNLNELCAFVL